MTISKCLFAAMAVALAGCATTHEASVGITRSSGEGIDSSAAWAAIDANNDGTVSIDELEQQHQMGLLQDFNNADTNGDKHLTKAEWDAWWPRMTDHHIRDDASAVQPLESAR